LKKEKEGGLRKKKKGKHDFLQGGEEVRERRTLHLNSNPSKTSWGSRRIEGFKKGEHWGREHVKAS